jgi:hypothetical protein
LFVGVKVDWSLVVGNSQSQCVNQACFCLINTAILRALQ